MASSKPKKGPTEFSLEKLSFRVFQQLWDTWGIPVEVIPEVPITDELCWDENYVFDIARFVSVFQVFHRIPFKCVYEELMRKGTYDMVSCTSTIFVGLVKSYQYPRDLKYYYFFSIAVWMEASVYFYDANRFRENEPTTLLGYADAKTELRRFYGHWASFFCNYLTAAFKMSGGIKKMTELTRSLPIYPDFVNKYLLRFRAGGRYLIKDGRIEMWNEFRHYYEWYKEVRNLEDLKRGPTVVEDGFTPETYLGSIPENKNLDLIMTRVDSAICVPFFYGPLTLKDIARAYKSTVMMTKPQKPSGIELLDCDTIELYNWYLHKGIMRTPLSKMSGFSDPESVELPTPLKIQAINPHLPLGIVPHEELLKELQSLLGASGSQDVADGPSKLQIAEDGSSQDVAEGPSKLQIAEDCSSQDVAESLSKLQVEESGSSQATNGNPSDTKRRYKDRMLGRKAVGGKRVFCSGCDTTHRENDPNCQLKKERK